MYYAFEVTDGALERTLSSLPQLCELNIGRCHAMTALGVSRALSVHHRKRGHLLKLQIVRVMPLARVW